MSERITPGARPPECAQFRRQAGADPAQLAADAAAHAGGCADCAAYLQELRALDARLLEALRVPVPPVRATVAALPEPARRAAVRVQWPTRRRWQALAASLVGGVAIGALLWVSAPRATLADALVDHVRHESQAMVSTATDAPPAVLAAVLARADVRLRPGAARISYANTCDFRGRRVPHLVVQSERGPLTVMLLRDERPDSAQDFELAGHRGAILPAGPGSIAVIGVDRVADRALLDAVAREVAEAIEWQVQR